LAFTALLAYGLWTCFEWWGIGGFFAWLLPGTLVIYKLIRIHGVKVHEVDLLGRRIRSYKVPYSLWRSWQHTGEAIPFSDAKGEPVFFAEELDTRKGLIRFAWTHRLSAIEYIMSASAFLNLREDFRNKTLRLAELELTFSEQLVRVAEGKVADRVRFLLGEDVEQEIAKILKRWQAMRWKHGPETVTQEAGEVG